MNTTQPNKKQRRAAQLLAHYATCERLGRYLGMISPDGKKISLALFKAEKKATLRSDRMCNDPSFTQSDMRATKYVIEADVNRIFHKLPPGFFINSDPRGYALKIDNESQEGKALIDAVKLQTDWGGFGLLSPMIDGN